MNVPSLHGVIVPVVTPFTEHNAVNLHALTQLIEYLIDAGVHGILVNGTTGEGPLLSPAERMQVAECAVQHAHGRIPIIVQAGVVSTAETVMLADHAHRIGAHAAAIVAPYFYHVDEAALIAHFCAVAASVPDLPLYLYNIPQRTGNNISAAITNAVAEHCPNVRGEKDSSGSLELMRAKRERLPATFELLIGSDELVLAGLQAGASGSVSGNANVVPELFVGLFDAYWRGDVLTAQRYQAKIDRVRLLLHDGADLSIFKYILQQRGVDVGTVRAPLRRAEAAVLHACYAQFTALDENLPLMASAAAERANMPAPVTVR